MSRSEGWRVPKWQAGGNVTTGLRASKAAGSQRLCQTQRVEGVAAFVTRRRSTIVVIIIVIIFFRNRCNGAEKAVLLVIDAGGKEERGDGSPGCPVSKSQPPQAAE